MIYQTTRRPSQKMLIECSCFDCFNNSVVNCRVFVKLGIYVMLSGVVVKPCFLYL
jgi:hypothetical protein